MCSCRGVDTTAPNAGGFAPKGGGTLPKGSGMSGCGIRVGAAPKTMGCSAMGFGGAIPKGGAPMGARTPPMTGAAKTGMGMGCGGGLTIAFRPFFFWEMASKDWRWAWRSFCIFCICSFMAAVWALVFFLVVEGGGLVTEGGAESAIVSSVARLVRLA